jgi:hypothetical protein
MVGVWLCVYTQPHITQNFTSHSPKSACNSTGTGELTEDGTQVPKHVAATELNNKTDKN